MTRHSIKAAFTRFVLIVSIATSIGVGSVGIGGTAEVSAMPVNCARLLLMARHANFLMDYFDSVGNVGEAYYFSVLMAHYDLTYLDNC